LRKPERLGRPSVAGVIGVPSALREQLTLNLKQTFQLAVRVAPEENPMDATALARDFMSFLSDPEVGAIFVSIGHEMAQAVIPSVDWKAARDHVKIIVLPTSAAALAFALRRESDVQSFLGPPLTSLAERPQIRGYTKRSMNRLLFRSDPPGLISPSTRWTDEPVRSRGRRRWLLNPGSVWIRRGRAEGTLLGGSLEAVSLLLGTDLWPDFSGSLLYLDPGEGPDAASSLEGLLVRLDEEGLLRRISGLVTGRGAHQTFDEHARIHAVLKSGTASAGIPVMADIDLGPSDPVMTVPFGARAALDPRRGFSVLEGGVMSTAVRSS